MPDIDIDFADRNKILDRIKHVPASIVEKDGTFKKHNTGVYCTSIPHNPLTGTASIDYKSAEDRGYFKLDFLNVSLYQQIKNEEQLTRLVNTEPLWDLLEQQEFSDMLFHINGHHSVLTQMKPRNILQLAAVLAMIRPAKRHLIGKGWNEVMSDVWVKPEGDEYYFKKAHAVAYSHVIVVQMNLICEGISYEYS
jgi:DNA polymerase III alpha subunit